jgi:uncharacterized protein (DUF1684 family)
MKALAIFAGMALMAASNYPSEIEQWRHQREANLRAEGGWLTLTGLFWLHEGANPTGTAGDNEIVLEDGPLHLGSIRLAGGKVLVSKDSNTQELRPDSSDVLRAGRLNLFVIKRGEKFGIRVKDPQSKARKEFHGLDYFPADEAYRVAAKWVAEPRQIPILNVLGQTEPSDCPGYAVFSLRGKEFKLYPIIESPGDQQLFYIFRDETSGKETYGAGRFLYSEMPRDGKVAIDFNKAYNPPCVFTPYATCPLPPPENRMAVRIEAGEKKYGNH